MVACSNGQYLLCADQRPEQSDSDSVRLRRRWPQSDDIHGERNCRTPVRVVGARGELDRIERSDRQNVYLSRSMNEFSSKNLLHERLAGLLDENQRSRCRLSNSANARKLEKPALRKHPRTLLMATLRGQ